MARAGKGSRGGEQGRGRGEDDTWGSSQQEVERRRWQSGGQERGTAPAAGGAEKSSTCPRERSEGPMCKTKRF
jgi:hypothetical protein